MKCARLIACFCDCLRGVFCELSVCVSVCGLCCWLNLFKMLALWGDAVVDMSVDVCCVVKCI